MSIRKVSLEVELQRLARGKKPTMPTQDIARWALTVVKVRKHDDEVEWLEKLYALEMGRPQLDKVD